MTDLVAQENKNKRREKSINFVFITHINWVKIIKNPKNNLLLGFKFNRIIKLIKVYFTSINSTSNIKVAFGGITPPAPRVP
jgi:hypothetical protein